jgi:lipopolysaccharide export system protein LptC
MLIMMMMMMIMSAWNLSQRDESFAQIAPEY